jgi:hypothetical protein
MLIGGHEENCLFFVTRLSPDTPLIFGLPWLQRHNPTIDWAEMSLTFNSWYCRRFCCQLPVSAPIVPDRPTAFHDLEILGEPQRLTRTIAESRKLSAPPRPTVEDAKDEEQPVHGCIDMIIEETLTPGRDPYRTYAVATGTSAQARLIGNLIPYKPAPAQVVGGQRRRSPRPPKRERPPPLSVSPPVIYNTDPPDFEDIRLSQATNFVHFCKSPGVQVRQVLWDDLDKAAELEKPKICLPDLTEQEYKCLLDGKGSASHWKALFPKETHDFIDTCMRATEENSGEHLRAVKDSDIEKYMTPKPELSKEQIIKKLPEWLTDMNEAFLPQIANQLPPRRAWDHKIELLPGKEPPYIKNRPFSPKELQVVRKWLDDNLDKGFIRESRSRSAAPLLLASKPGGGVRICQDYRGLNNVTIKNQYPLPLIRETLDALCNAKVYTKLDIIAAFNKLRIAEGHEWKTAFITRFGLYESLVMPFGLCNAPASFQNYINHTLHDLLDRTCTAYLDDVLIYSANRKDHRTHVREVVKRLMEAGLQIDINKCEFETTETKYLGLIITPGGIKMDPEKVQTIIKWTPPLCLKDLQKFLGFANFYRRFIRDFSKICRPLNDLMQKDKLWHWGDEQHSAFEDLKRSFTTAPVLSMFDYTKRTVLETDASDWASGGVLSQYDDDGLLRPVAYFSSKHSAHECNYEIYDKELLAIIKCMEEWRPELQGTPERFEILTDHKNLEYFTSTKALNQRQVRWSEFLSQFNFQIIYRPGAKAVRPDALSRKPGDRPSKSDINDDRIKNRERTVLDRSLFDAKALQDLMDNAAITTAPIDIIMPAMDKPIDDIIDGVYQRSEMAAEMAEAIQNKHIQRWPRALRKVLRVAMTDCNIHGGRIYYKDRLFAPPDDELRTQILYRAHSVGPAGHPGRVKTLELVTRDYWWPRISRDVEEYVKACELCVRTKSSRLAPQGFLQPLPVPFRAWSDISVDYITPLPESKFHGTTYKHLLVVVCRLTKMRHLIPVPSLTVEDLVDAFVSRVYCLHGTPDNIVSDRGTQFVSAFWEQLSQRLGVKLKHSSSFHPETDGQTERINAAVEQFLRAFMNFSQDDWVKWLPIAEFAMNNVVSETTGVSPFFANYGFNPRLGTEPSRPCPPNMTETQKKQFYKANAVADRFERIISQLKAIAAESIAKYEHYANTKREDAPRFVEGQLVYINTRNMKTNRPMKKGDDKLAGPHKITKVYPRACAVELPPSMRIFPVFHNSLLRAKPPGNGLPGQIKINEAESRNLRGRVLERDDETEELVEKWEFESILDCHNQYGDLQYLVKWKDHAPSWQPATDLKGNNTVIFDYHDKHPGKPGPPTWAKRSPVTRSRQKKAT